MMDMNRDRHATVDQQDSPDHIGSSSILAELRGIREEVIRLRLQHARTMALLMALVRPMTPETAAQIEARLMAMDDEAARPIDPVSPAETAPASCAA